MNKNIIENLTQDIIKTYKINIPLFDIDDLVTKLGGQVDEVSNLKYTDFYGVRKENDSFVISIPLYSNRQNRRFRIAEEIGTLFINMGFKTNPELWNSQPNGKVYKLKETEANYLCVDFARSLLMPKNEYIKYARECTHGKKVNTNLIAEHFGVSLSEASRRGISLGYLEDIWSI